MSICLPKNNNAKYGDVIRMKNAFILNAYGRAEKIQGYCSGILNYLEKNNISIEKNQMLLFGRALTDLYIGDILLTPKGNQIKIDGFHLYGNRLDFVSIGCTCIIICDAVTEVFTVHTILKLFSNFP